MDDSDTDNSGMFKVDHTNQFNCQQQATEKRLQNLFNKDKTILNDGQKRMVVYGTMEQQPRSIYEILQPYFWKAAALTGQAATYAGKGIYNALSTGANWIYDKVVHNVIPYTQQEIPKWILIIKGGNKVDKQIENSGSFQVLEVDENDYNEIKKKQKNKTKTRVIVPLDPNSDPQFIQFLKRQNFVPHTSFPIDVDSDVEQQTMVIPSASFKLRYNEAVNKQLALQQYQTSEIKMQNQNTEKQAQKKKQQNIQNNVANNNQKIEQSIKSIKNEESTVKQVQNYKKIEKKVIKLKDCYIFELQGRNSIQYDFLDGMQKDENTQCGYLLKSNKFNISKISDNSQGSNSGEVPLVVQKNFVDNTRNVRVEIPQQKTISKQSRQESKKQFQLA